MPVFNYLPVLLFLVSRSIHCWIGSRGKSLLTFILNGSVMFFSLVFEKYCYKALIESYKHMLITCSGIRTSRRVSEVSSGMSYIPKEEDNTYPYWTIENGEDFSLQVFNFSCNLEEVTYPFGISILYLFQFCLSAFSFLSVDTHYYPKCSCWFGRSRGGEKEELTFHVFKSLVLLN